MLELLYYVLLLIIGQLNGIVSCHSYIRSSSTVDSVAKHGIPQIAKSNIIACIRHKQRYPHLLAFHKEGCEFCKDMEPLIHQANSEFGLHIERLDVASSYNYALMLKLDKQANCGGLPFFYNLRTHRHICGATTYQNLVAWATGKRSSALVPPSLKEEEIKASYRKTGFYARLMMKIKNILLKGEKKMMDRLSNQ